MKTALSNRSIIWLSLLMALLMMSLKWVQWKYLFLDHSIELYTLGVAIIFTVLGAWIANQWVKGKTLNNSVVELLSQDISLHEKTKGPELFQLSQREWEVLLHIGKGMSNQQIAEALYISVSTVKTHTANLFAKMEVKSRLQALEKARRLGLLP